MKAYTVTRLDDGAKYIYLASTPYDAMSKHLYYLNQSNLDKNAKICMTESVRSLYLDHCGVTYAIENTIKQQESA